MVLIRFPFSDLSSDKLRPALVVGGVSGDDAILAFVSSQLSRTDSDEELLLEPSNSEFRATGLKTSTLIRLSKLATLNRWLIRRRIGKIGPSTQGAVKTGLRFVNIRAGSSDTSSTASQIFERARKLQAVVVNQAAHHGAVFRSPWHMSSSGMAARA